MNITNICHVAHANGISIMEVTTVDRQCFELHTEKTGLTTIYAQLTGRPLVAFANPGDALEAITDGEVQS